MRRAKATSSRIRKDGRNGPKRIAETEVCPAAGTATPTASRSATSSSARDTPGAVNADCILLGTAVLPDGPALLGWVASWFRGGFRNGRVADR